MKSQDWMEKEYDRVGKGLRKISIRGKIIRKIMSLLIQLSEKDFAPYWSRYSKYDRALVGLRNERFSILGRRKLLRRLME